MEIEVEILEIDIDSSYGMNLKMGGGALAH